ncbi:hypothetical protein NliqN6_1868 [Naganishia liquefaciens]|uniref:ferroxidase n=1 Tax=Naganishia liquefaciens TaxID=104408 RepID=A0A8H3YF91_9TREE|nr:hypothetical protein NliqN6_1868 [Naganishia liquefaciens]
MQPAAEAPGSFSPTPLATTMTSAAYDRLATETMDTLYDSLEQLVEEWSPEGTHGWEVEYSSGVLTLGLGPHGTYVINKQPPNQQIWMSSPFSGPARFSYAPKDAADATSRGARWFYARDGVTLGSVLDQEIKSVLVAEVGERDAQAWQGSGVP